MNGLVEKFMRLERELLAHRLTQDLAGIAYSPEDPVEQRLDDEFDTVWEAMTKEERRLLRVTREVRSLPWTGGGAGVLSEPRLVDGPSPRSEGLPVRRLIDRSQACT